MTTNTTGLPDITKETHDAIFKAPWVIRFMEKTGNTRKMLVDLMLRYSIEGPELSLQEFIENASKVVRIAEWKKTSVTSENVRRASDRNSLDTKGLKPEDVGKTEEDFTPLELAA
jgi:hypothetical protein|tara:strand:+ start:151 stop:495 length:345 start_codon:yes stop_codon:yes gene_type:complete